MYKHLFQGIACTGTAPGGGKKSEWGQIQAPERAGGDRAGPPRWAAPPSATPAQLFAPGGLPVRPGVARSVRGHK